MQLDLDTQTTPPDTTTDDGDDDEERSLRVSVHAYDGDTGRAIDAGVQLFGDDADNPEKFAAALLDAAFGCAAVRGPSYAWAAAAAFAAFDGTRR
jgi:hypothetical protein